MVNKILDFFKIKNKNKFKKNFLVFCMLIIPILNLLIFYFYVNFNSIIMAFQRNNHGQIEWSLYNFQKLFEEIGMSNSIIWQSLKNTLIFFFVGFAIINPLSLLFAYFFFKKIKGYKIFRYIFFLPSIISGAVLVTLYKYMIAPDGVIAVIMMKLFNTPVPTFLTDSRYALITIIIYVIWTGFGVNMILFSGAMKRIPQEIIDSAKIDGVSMPRELFSIVIPMIWPTISSVILFAVVGIFTASGPILLFTKGDSNTYTISYWIFEQVNDTKNYEYASAVGLFFSVLGLPIVLGIKKLLNKLDGGVEY